MLQLSQFHKTEADSTSQPWVRVVFSQFNFFGVFCNTLLFVNSRRFKKPWVWVIFSKYKIFCWILQYSILCKLKEIPACALHFKEKRPQLPKIHFFPSWFCPQQRMFTSRSQTWEILLKGKEARGYEFILFKVNITFSKKCFPHLLKQNVSYFHG